MSKSETPPARSLPPERPALELTTGRTATHNKLDLLVRHQTATLGPKVAVIADTQDRILEHVRDIPRIRAELAAVRSLIMVGVGCVMATLAVVVAMAGTWVVSVKPAEIQDEILGLHRRLDALEASRTAAEQGRDSVIDTMRDDIERIDREGSRKWRQFPPVHPDREPGQ